MRFSAISCHFRLFLTDIHTKHSIYLYIRNKLEGNMPPLSNPQKAKILQLRHQGLGVRRTWIKLGELWPDVKFNQGTVGKWWHRAGTQFQQECNLQRKVHTSAISQDCRPITMHEWLGPILCTIQILCTNPNLLQHCFAKIATSPLRCTGFAANLCRMSHKCQNTSYSF